MLISLVLVTKKKFHYIDSRSQCIYFFLGTGDKEDKLECLSLTNFSDLFWPWSAFYSFQLGAVKSLAQTLRRYTGLNHLAQAARAVLQNSAQINQVASLLFA